MSDPLPAFRYHPDPVATGSVVPSDGECVCCGRARGYVYSGPVYCADEYEECICPWCIADGTAGTKFAAEFTDAHGVGGGGAWEAVSAEVREVVVKRTPGFAGWQSEQWWTHCGDAAAFLGRAGRNELQQHGIQAIQAIRESTGLDPGAMWDEFFGALDRDGSPTAYLFRCLSCGQLGGYQDCD